MWNKPEWNKPDPNVHMGFPYGSDSEESAHNAGDLGSIPVLGRSPGGGHGNPLQYPCLENPHEQRSLVGYSLWGHEEADTTKHSIAKEYMLFVSIYINSKRQK